MKPSLEPGCPPRAPDLFALRVHSSLCHHGGLRGEAAASRLFSLGLLRCPVCERRVLRFLPHGAPLRAGARCPHCGALERHRSDLLFLRERTNLFNGPAGRKLLHVAPEPCLERIFRAAPGLDYLSADLMDPQAMMRFDLCAIPFADGHFDCIYCSHVLEHIPDDRTALREMFRVTKPGGWALLQVPVVVTKTFEDASIVSEAARVEAYGQGDHVRAIGPDYADRIREAGWAVEALRVRDMASLSHCSALGLDANQWIFFARREA